MAFCGECGGENPENAKFCGHCGARQAQPTENATPLQATVSLGTLGVEVEAFKEELHRAVEVFAGHERQLLSNKDDASSFAVDDFEQVALRFATLRGGGMSQQNAALFRWLFEKLDPKLASETNAVAYIQSLADVEKEFSGSDPIGPLDFGGLRLPKAYDMQHATDCATQEARLLVRLAILVSRSGAGIEQDEQLAIGRLKADLMEYLSQRRW